MILIIQNLDVRFLSDIPWFSANWWEGTNSSAVELVPSPGSHNFKVQCLVKLAKFFWLEPKPQNNFSIGRDNPTEYTQSERYMQSYICY